MKLLTGNILFTIAALLLIMYAPDYYSYDFCLVTAWLFIIQNAIYFVFRRDRGIVGFEFFFMIAFWFTNFVYPLFYFQTDPSVGAFAMSYNQNIVSKATSVAYLAYSAYFVGLSFFEIKRFDFKVFEIDENYESTSRKVFFITISFFLLYVVTGGHKVLGSVYSGDASLEDQGISSYFYMIFFSSSILLTIFLFSEQISKKYKIQYISLIAFIFLLFMLLGSRTLPLALGLAALVSYNNYKYKIPASVFLLLVVLGTALMTFVVFARSGSFSDEGYFHEAINNMQINSFWDFGMDLIMNNRNLYTLVDFADNQGYTYGLTMLGGFLSPIPFLQGFVCSTFGIPPDFIGSATFNTFLEFGPGSTWGLGTNLVADVYLAFGIFGTIFFFLAVGLLLGKAKIASSGSLYWNIFYFFLVSNSVYWLRSGFFDSFRYLTWAMVIVFVLNIKFNQKKSSEINVSEQ